MIKKSSNLNLWTENRCRIADCSRTSVMKQLARWRPGPGALGRGPGTAPTAGAAPTGANPKPAPNPNLCRAAARGLGGSRLPFWPSHPTSGRAVRGSPRPRLFLPTVLGGPAEGSFPTTLLSRGGGGGPSPLEGGGRDSSLLGGGMNPPHWEGGSSSPWGRGRDPAAAGRRGRREAGERTLGLVRSERSKLLSSSQTAEREETPLAGGAELRVWGGGSVSVTRLPSPDWGPCLGWLRP